jgi:hypothetical protein
MDVVRRKLPACEGGTRLAKNISSSVPLGIYMDGEANDNTPAMCGASPARGMNLVVADLSELDERTEDERWSELLLDTEPSVAALVVAREILAKTALHGYKYPRTTLCTGSLTK